jgi:glycosyltransferase involved in cell wall biosynthesis
MKCHVISLFHTINDPVEYCHCAFTQKVVKLVKMLQMAGYYVIEYGNEGSKSGADEMVTVLTKEEFAHFYPPLGPTDFFQRYCNWSERGGPLFRKRVEELLRPRVSMNDIMCHPFGACDQHLVFGFPYANHVETGVGYEDEPFGCWRIYESEAWRHFHWGMFCKKEISRTDNGRNRNYSWVIPNSYDLDDWPICPVSENKGYVLYMGRLVNHKGTYTMISLIKAMPTQQFVFAGQGDFQDVIGQHLTEADRNHVKFVGHSIGRDRAKLVGQAKCMIMPSEYIEPFGGAGVEGQLTGTPLISVDYAAFTETVLHGLTGFRCHTLGDWISAIYYAHNLDRQQVAELSRARYSLEACAPQYRAAFEQILDLGPIGADGVYRQGRQQGWYTRQSYRIPQNETLDFLQIEIEERPQAARLAGYLKDNLAPDDVVLDVGCATGFYVDEMRAVGLKAMGVDITESLVESDYLFRMDVTDPAAKAPKASVVVSLEVAEHIDYESAQRYFDFIERTGCHTVYFSGAHPGQGGIGHVNCQPQEYWIEQFVKRGFVHDIEATSRWIDNIRGGYHMHWLRYNGIVFKRGKQNEITKQSITVRRRTGRPYRTSASKSGNGAERPATDQRPAVAAGDSSDYASAGTGERL